MKKILCLCALLCPFLVSNSYAIIELNARGLYAMNSSSYTSDHKSSDKKGLGYGASALFGLGFAYMGLDVSKTPIVDGNVAGVKSEGDALTGLFVMKFKLPYIYVMGGVGLSKVESKVLNAKDDHHAPTAMLSGGLQVGNAFYGLDLGLRYTIMMKSHKNIQQIAPTLGIYFSI